MLKKTYSNRIKVWVKKEKVIDVVIFGSSVRGSHKPKDVDLCIILDDETRSLELVQSLGELVDSFGLVSHVNTLTPSGFLGGNTLSRTLLEEGYSVKHSKSLSSLMGFKNQSMFTYTLKSFSPSRRVQFHYMLKGRYGSSGMLKEVGGNFVGTGTIMLPSKNEDVLKEVFDKWKVKYSIKRMLVS